MFNQVIGTMKLSGQDARAFARSLYRPSHEEILRHNRYLDEINEGVAISREKDGFQADIADLDLSFLDEKVEPSSINIKVTLKISVQSKGYVNGNMISHETGVVTKTVSEYSRSSADKYFVWAA